MTDEIDLLLARVDSLEQRERFGEALQVARQACAMQPGEPAVWEVCGEMALRSGDAAEAVTALERLTTLEPRSADAWFGLGEALLWDRRREEAQVCFVRAALLDPRAHVTPFRVTEMEFEAMAGTVLKNVPEPVIDFLEDTGTAVAVRPLPAVAMVVGAHLDPHALGYWLGNVHGVPGGWGGINPAAIEIYQLNIENWCGDRVTLSEEIRRTVLHEVGHALGMDHGALSDDGY
jgi:predicted Zn-dependent protease with MMP-like domain